MDILLTLAGIVLFGLVMWDFIASTVGTQGQGRFSEWIGGRFYTLFTLLPERAHRPGLRRLAGPTVLILVGALWVLGTWTAWTLIFFGTGALQVTATQEPSDLPATFTFVGSSLSTAGNSDLETSGFLGDLLTVLAAVQGMAVLTLTVSFLLNLTQTVMQGRAFSLDTSSSSSLSEMDRSAALATFRSLCARLHVYPLSLYFAPPYSDASLPDAIVRYAQLVQSAPDATRRERETVKKGLRLLPFTPEGFADAPSADALDPWKRRYGTSGTEGRSTARREARHG